MLRLIFGIILTIIGLLFWIVGLSIDSIMDALIGSTCLIMAFLMSDK